jgi:hypothetical protein
MASLSTACCLALFKAALVAVSPLPQAEAREIELIDFKTVKNDLVGQRVKLHGLILNFSNDYAMLREGDHARRSVMIEISLLDRDTRRRLFSQECDDGCPAAVTGDAARIWAGDVGLVVHQLAWLEER